MSRARLIVVPFALALLGGACGGNTAAPPSPAAAVTGTEAAPTTAPSAGPTTTKPAAPATTRAGGASPTTKDSGAPIPAGKLQLRPGGISTIDFGAPEADTVARLSARLGTPERHDGERSVCPGYRSAYWPKPEIAVWFDQEGALVGWSVRAAGGAELAEHVAVGTTVATLRRLYGPRLTLEDTSLGHGFVVDTGDPDEALVGLVDRTDDTGTITSLWSGFTCTAH